MTDPDTVAAAIADADEVVVLTGAGLSTASGIPDFRSEGGLWDVFDEEAFTLRRYRAQPERFWSDWLSLHEHFFDSGVAPNPAHDALAQLEQAGHLDALLTQNVDGLHPAAGSESIVHLHGTGTRATCPDCGASMPVEAARERVESGEGAPTCDCGGVYKPDTVLFGEQLPPAAMQEARRRAETADVFLAAGSSLTVDPAGLLPDTALRNGATLVVVNLDRTKYAGRADHVAREPVEEFLPAVAARVVELADG
ncbi:NAD-dependent protein deacylase [Haloarchaeobius salinus]|uniref:NAD-dependent protein deacylase n=1 Tax=Haloarchaeobius salinus TaxID=1198298 RepID=UPI00210E94FA|nr:NAD-dependent protein deacylase [Haloarchaeobius salinus]